jgi:hypothetical protein
MSSSYQNIYTNKRPLLGNTTYDVLSWNMHMQIQYGGSSDYCPTANGRWSHWRSVESSMIKGHLQNTTKKSVRVRVSARARARVYVCYYLQMEWFRFCRCITIALILLRFYEAEQVSRFDYEPPPFPNGGCFIFHFTSLRSEIRFSWLAHHVAL